MLRMKSNTSAQVVHKRSELITYMFDFFLKKIKKIIYRERGRGGERERERERERETLMCERNIAPLPLACSHPGIWPTSQAYALTGNRTSDLSVCGMMPNPLSHASQG